MVKVSCLAILSEVVPSFLSCSCCKFGTSNSASSEAKSVNLAQATQTKKSQQWGPAWCRKLKAYAITVVEHVEQLARSVKYKRGSVSLSSLHELNERVLVRRAIVPHHVVF